MRKKKSARALRLITAEFKKVEVDERIEVDDARAHRYSTKCVSNAATASSSQDAGRDELAAVEQAEIDVISEFLPEAISDEELSQMVSDAIAQSGAAGMQDMGKVMGILKPKVQGRADMGKVSQMVKSQF